MKSYWLKMQGTRFPVRRGEIVVGRSPYCSVVLGNGLASRQHCVFRLDSEGLFVSDLGSSNGTLVNGRRLTAEQKLEAGDVIQVGTQLLEVQAPEAEDSRTGAKTEQVEDLASDTDNHSLGNELPTATHNSTVELIETLVASAATTKRPLATLPVIRRALDSVVEHQRQGMPLPPTTRTRLRAIAEQVSAWVEDGSLDAWRAGVVEALENPP